MLNDSDLADILIARLNQLCGDPAVKADIAKLIDQRIQVSPATIQHPTLQVQDQQLGVLGLLNGLVGINPDGPGPGWGYIAADYDDTALELLGFVRTKKNGLPSTNSVTSVIKVKRLILEIDGEEKEYKILNGLQPDEFVYMTTVHIEGDDLKLSQSRVPVGGWDAWRERNHKDENVPT